MKQAMQSFPSGHSGMAFAVGTFLALYLNAKLKAWSGNRVPIWKQMAVLAPLVGAVIIAGGLMIDRVSFFFFFLLFFCGTWRFGLEVQDGERDGLAWSSLLSLFL